MKVVLTDAAARDLEDIAEYIALHDSPKRALRVLSKIEETLRTLGTNPQSGAYVKELESLGNREFRQVLYKPFRIVYHVSGEQVYVSLIADGRRDMQSLLERRLLES